LKVRYFIIYSYCFAFFLLFAFVTEVLNAQTFLPVAWPSEVSYRPATLLNQSINDYKVQDPSNGGTSPQSYANISSGTPDLTLPSIYYATNGTTLFIRFRVEGNGLLYAPGQTAGSTDPWNSIQWTMLLDVNGDGWRDFALFVDGASGEPSAQIDVIKVLYSNLTTSQTVDVSVSGVYLLSSYYTAQAYSSGQYAGQLKQYDGNGNLITTNVWSGGRTTAQVDFGVTRATNLTGTNGDYTVEYQIPMSALDASAYGGPVVSTTTPVTAFFATANSLNNPFQKDAAFAGTLFANPGAPFPGGDNFTFDGGPIVNPIVTSVAATGCPSVSLTAKVIDAMKLVNGVSTTTVSSVNFYYWYDANGDDSANDGGSSWTLIGAGSTTSLGIWTKSWNTTALTNGQYLVKVIATDEQSNSTDSYTENYGGGYSNIYASVSNNCGTSPPYLSKSVTPTSVSSVADSASRIVTYTISITNPSSSSFTLSSFTDQLPTGFSYIANASGGTLTPATSPSANSTGSITWTFSSPTIAGSSTATLKFYALASTTVGTYANSVSAVGSTSITSVNNTASVNVTDASISLSKSASTIASVTEGQSVTYTISYQNNGSASLSNVVITDSLVAGLNYSSSSNSGSFNGSTRKVTWNIGSLSVGQSGSVTVTITISSPFSGTSPLTNSASASATEIVTTTTSNTVSNSVAGPQLSFSKLVSPTSAVPGDFLTYTLTYGNSGISSASNVTIIDTLPSNVSYVTGTATPITPSVSGNVLTFSVGSVASGSVNNTITFQVSVANPYPSAGSSQSVSNTGHLSSTQTTSISSTTTFTVNAIPTVSISKTSDKTSYASTDTAVFTITLTNSGNAPATLSSIQDSLPTGFTYVSTSGGTLSASTSPTNGSSGTVSWTFSSTTINASSSATLIFRAKVSSTAGTYQNTAKATGILISGSSSTISASVVFIVSSGTENFTKSTNKTSGFVGDTITYTIYYVNSSGGTQPNRNIRDTLPSSLTFVSQTGTSSDASTVTFSQVGNALKWVLQNPYPNSTNTTITIKAIANISGTISNTAQLWGGGGAGSLQLTSNTVSTTIAAAPNFSFTKTVSRSTAPEKATLTYTISYSNTGGAASNVVIRDTIPTNVSYRTGTATNGGSYTSSPGKGFLKWNIGSVASSGSGSVTFSVTVDSPVTVSTVIPNTAYLTNNENANKSSTVNVTVQGLPNFALAKSVDKSLAGPGDTLTYSITYQNTGSASASNTVITDNIGSNLSFVSATGGGVESGGTVTWNIGNVNAGTSSSVTLKLRIVSPLARNSVSQVTNTASISATSVSSINSNTSTTTVSYPDLSISKTVDSTLINAGNTMTYTIIVTNTSFASAVGTILYDSIPSNTSYVTNSTYLNSTPVTDISGTSALVTGVTIGTLTTGQSVTIQFSVSVNSPITNNTRIYNRARATTTNITDVTYGNVVSSTVQSTPTLTLSKAASVSGSSIPGATITYTLTYGNSGTTSAENVYITDAIPSNTKYVSSTVSGTGTSYDAVNNQIIVSRSSLAAGTSGQTASFQVKVNSPLPSGTTAISNSATASGSNATSVSANTSTNITATSTFSVSKSTSVTNAGLTGNPLSATFTYTISYSVSGNATVDSVFLIDTLQSGLAYQSSTLNGSSSGTAIGQIVTWDIGSVSPGTSGQATVTVKATSTGTYTNKAKITSTQSGSATLSNTTSTNVTNTYTGTISQTATILPSNSITITVTDHDLKSEGLIFVTVVNTVTNESEQIGLFETTSNSGIFTKTVSTIFGTTAGTNNDGYFNAQAGDTIRATYNDTVDSSGNTANVSSSTRVIGGYTATLTVAPSLVAPGNSLTFTLTDLDLNYDTSSAETYSYTATSNQGETENLSLTETGNNTGIFTATVGTTFGTPPGTNNNGTFTVQSTNTISLSYFDSLTTPGTTATISATATIGNVNLSASSKSVTDLNAGSSIPNDTMSYTIKVKNTGNVAATSITVYDTIPSGINVVTATISHSGTLSSGIITFPAFAVGVNDSVLLTYKALIDTSVQDEDTVINTALISGHGTTKTVQSSFVASNRPLMSLAKSVDKSSAIPGDTLTYTVVYTNIGSSVATNVIVSDSIKQTTEYVAGSVTINNVTQTDNGGDGVVSVNAAAIQITIGQVQAGQSGTIKFKVRVK